MVVGHVEPEAAEGLDRPGARGRSITIDAHALVLVLVLVLQLSDDDAGIARRRAAWQPPAPRYTRGVLAKFARNASSASGGALLD